MVKKFVMTTVWRISQTGPLLSIFFWSSALAGIFWPIVGRSDTPQGPLFQFLTRDLSIPAERATLVGLSLLFLFFAVTILVIGFVYDRVLRLWREQMVVTYERNPYADDLLFRKERLQWDQFYLPLARAMLRISRDRELEVAIGRVERWVATGRIEPVSPSDQDLRPDST